MPPNAQVTIFYGPYESGGVVQHRDFRLQGLQVALTSRGHQWVMVETQHWNMVELVVNGQLVFTCRIQQLEFGGDGQLDPVCQEAVAAVEDA